MNRVKNLRYWVMGLALLLAGCETLPPPAPVVPQAPIDTSLLQGVTALVVWGKNLDHTLVAYYDPQSKLYWALPVGYDPTKQSGGNFHHMTYGKARDFIANLSIDAQGGWDLPSFNEVTESNSAYSLKTWEQYHFSRDKTTYDYRTGGEKPCSQGAYRIDDGVVKRRCATDFQYSGSEYGFFVPVRRRSIFDEVIEAAGKSPEQKLAELTALLVKQKMAFTPVVLIAPIVPAPITASALVKGEFELTEVFQKRVAAEAERVRLANETAQRNHEAALKTHQEAVDKQQREEAERIKHNQEPAVISATIASVTPVAIAMLYGDPVLENFNYVADKQVFAGIVKSSKGGFSHPVELAVPLSKAEQIKKQLTEGDLIPAVTFDTRTTALGTELVFVKLDLVENLAKQLAKQKQDFANCKSSGNYRWFIGLYPNSPLVAQAKQRIIELDAADERARIAKLSADQQAAAAAVSAQKAEREFLTLGNCEVGATVYHRERWNTTTSSGNVLADALFNAATRESFVIHFEGVVEGFLGDKVKVTINDYQVQQTQGGGFFARKTYQGASLGIYADKYIGKVQFYPRSRCSK